MANKKIEKILNDWKEKRINAINKIVKNKYQHEHYINEYCCVLNSKANNKKEYKKEREIKCRV